MKNLFTLGISLLMVLGAFAQKIDYDNSSKWFLGFNVGGTWNTTDVNSQLGGGWGITLGKSYNYNYGKRTTFDLRARYLGGLWYGQDVDTVSLAGYAGGPLQPYADSLGYTVNNFSTELHSLSLELVLHANGIRERSGWDPYIFGGIGLKWYQTMGDLYGYGSLDSTSGNGIYDYSSLDNFSQISVNTLLDGIYETALTGSDANKFSFGIMPSLGFGLGYQIGRRVTLGLEHKTTFTLMDNFDGYEDASGKRANDLYHYTSLYLQFRFRNGRGSGGSSSNSNINNYNTNNNLTNCNVPVIVFRDPSADAQLVSGQLYTVKADISNITGRDKITFMHNGVISTNFTYDPNTGRVESNVVLAPGANTFLIKAFNACGNVQSSISVTYQNCVNPVVMWVNPPASGNVVFTQNMTLSAQLTGITGRENILFSQNGINSTAFVYNPVNGTFEANVNLALGENRFEIAASNACGVDVKPISITYQNCLSPLITFIDPSSANLEKTAQAFTVKAKIENISNAQQVQFKLNGVLQTGGTYNSNTKIYSKVVNLAEGGNTIELIATTNCGSNSAITTVIYRKPTTPVVQAPVINVQSPSACPLTVNPGTVNVSGIIQNVTSASQVSITVNGQPVTQINPTAVGNGIKFQFSISAVASVGTYTIAITAVNAGGTATYNCTITVNQPVVEEQKITICHYPPGNNGNPQTIEIPVSAWPAHQAHGDKLGPCPEVVQPEQKITICHYPPGNNGNPQTIEIPVSAWPAHQAHGDKLGPCPETTPVDNGNSGDNRKITICHYPPGNNGNPQTIEIPLSAWPAHQAHGDVLGPCPESTPVNQGGNVNGNQGGNGNGGDNRKITICHYPPGNTGNPQTLEIPLSAWPAHQAHGDVLGPCPETTPGSQGGNGNQGNNGNQGGNGNGNQGNNGNQSENSNQGNNQEQKITICHYPPGNNGNPQTLEIPLSAWPAHQAHGDVLGPCPETTPGNQGGNGNGNQGVNGNGNQGNNGNQGTNGNGGSGNTNTGGQGTNDNSGTGNSGSGGQGSNGNSGSGNTNTGSQGSNGNSGSGNTNTGGQGTNGNSGTGNSGSGGQGSNGNSGSGNMNTGGQGINGGSNQGTNEGGTTTTIGSGSATSGTSTSSGLNGVSTVGSGTTTTTQGSGTTTTGGSGSNTSSGGQGSNGNSGSGNTNTGGQGSNGNSGSGNTNTGSQGSNGNRVGSADGGANIRPSDPVKDDASKRAAEDAAKKKAEEDAKKRTAEDAAKKKAEEDAKKRAAEDAAKKKSEEKPKTEGKPAVEGGGKTPTSAPKGRG